MGRTSGSLFSLCLSYNLRSLEATWFRGKRVILDSEGQASEVLLLSIAHYVRLGNSQSLETPVSTAVKLGCGGIGEVVSV